MIKYKRTENTIRNTIFGTFLRLINMIGAFIARTVIIYTLGIEYVGLDGLFISVLSILNMAEMGFGSAVVFKLYRPIAEEDNEKVGALLNYYKKIYRIIGSVVGILGFSIIPFLGNIVRGELPGDINIHLLYLIYLINVIFSYWFFAYKTALLNAQQRNDLVSKISCFTFSLKYIAQIVFLLITKNYYVFAIIVPITTLLTNIGNLIIANKYYPQYIVNGNIDNEDKKEIKAKVTALLYNKIGIAVINGSDNIVISSFLGLAKLGIYSSYYYIFTLLHSVFDVIYNGITGGIGNSIVTESVETNYKLFKKLFFFNNWIVGWVSICMACIYEPFMKQWIGIDKSLPPMFSFLMAFYFYIWMIRFIILIFKNAQGLWREDRFRALIEGILNLVVNILLVNMIGLYGVVLSTIIAMIIVSIPWETKVLFQKYFMRSTFSYYKTMIVNTIKIVLTGGITYFLCIMLKINSNIIAIVYRGLVCTIIPNLILFIICLKTEEKEYIKEVYEKINHRIKRGA